MPGLGFGSKTLLDSIAAGKRREGAPSSPCSHQRSSEPPSMAIQGSCVDLGAYSEALKIVPASRIHTRGRVDSVILKGLVQARRATSLRCKKDIAGEYGPLLGNSSLESMYRCSMIFCSIR
jgi:hypothetical protein